MLVGNRLGFKIEGCNLPGHFLARVQEKNKVIFIDGFNKGKLYSPLELSQSREFNVSKFSGTIFKKVEVNVIILRILRNLINSYSLRESITEETFYRKLLAKTLEIGERSSVTPN